MLGKSVLFAIVGAALVLAPGLPYAHAQKPPAPITPSVDSEPVPPAAAPAERFDCPPGVDPNQAPKLGDQTSGSASGTLSDQLAASRGVVCPPKGVDPEIVEHPPEGGTIRVIPPPSGSAVPK